MTHVILRVDDDRHLTVRSSDPEQKGPHMSDLNLDVHIAPMRPMKGAPPQGPGDEPMWSPMSATLIHGEQEAILVDTLVTFDQVDALAEWIKGFGKRLVGIYITHGHSDHWIGISQLRKHFGDVPAWARPKVQQRAAFEATNPGLSGYWQSVFPGEIPAQLDTPDTLDSTTIELEGSEIKIIDIGWGDTEFSTIIQVPSIAAVVAGDVVYNEVHMMTAETDASTRQAWIDNLNEIAALDPKIVVSGHHRVGAPTNPESIGESQQYLLDFSKVVEEQETVEDIVKAMLELHPDRDNPRVVWHCAREAVKKRERA
jgi:glyoxylase-like metal-dependent hydrolase (beta-lactamase superfamily II)